MVSVAETSVSSQAKPARGAVPSAMSGAPGNSGRSARCTESRARIPSVEPYSAASAVVRTRGGSVTAATPPCTTNNSPVIRASPNHDLVGHQGRAMAREVVQHNPGAGRRERARPPQPVAGAGYSRRFAVEPAHGPSRSPGESTKRLLGARVTAGQPVAGVPGQVRCGRTGAGRTGCGAGRVRAGRVQGGPVRAGQVRAGPGAVVPAERIRRQPSTTWSAL